MLKILKQHRLLVAITALIFLLFTYSNSAKVWEKGLFGVFQNVLPYESIPVNTAIVAIDSASLTANGNWPWSWSEIATLVQRLKSARVASIALNLPLHESQNALKENFQQQFLAHASSAQRDDLTKQLNQFDPDEQLSRVLKSSNNVIVALPYSTVHKTFTYSHNASIPSLLERFALSVRKFSPSRYLHWAYNGDAQMTHLAQLPAPLFFQATTNIGLSQNDITYNQRKLAERLVIKIDNQYYASLVLQSAAAFLGASADAIKVLEDRGVLLGNKTIYTDANYQFYPKLTKNKQGKLNIPVYSAQEILSNNVTLKAVRNKAVVVGIVDQQDQAQFYGQGKTAFSEVSWIANAVNATISGKYFKSPYWASLLQRGLILLFTLYLLLIPSRLRGKLGLWVGVFIAVVLINTSLILLLIQALWIPLLVPALFLFCAHVILLVHYNVTGIVFNLKTVASEANRKLAATLQSQGKLDQAFEYLQKCDLDDNVMEDLYKLGLEFERRRQFNNALSIFDYIANKNSNYRDIEDRRKRHSALPEHKLLANNSLPSNSSTLVLDNPQVERPILGRYQIEEIIGKGAMGTVYMGKDPKIGRTVAIKTLALSEEFEVPQLDGVKTRFFREAETAGRLHHPNIVTIFDVGEEHDLAYIAMEYVEGLGLDNYTHNSNLLPLEEVFAIGNAVARALDYAHNNSVVHRDVKPANIIYNVKSKVIKMTDFGIAVLTDANKTRTGMVLGSPSYMSPEQLDGKKVDGRSDLYSLGVSLYQLFTGSLPFTADSMAGLAYKIANEKPKSIRKIRSELPTCLTRIINKALEKNPKQRYQSGTELADALQRCQ